MRTLLCSKSIKNLIQTSGTLLKILPRSTCTRLYSSSSSNNAKRTTTTPATPQKKELPFVHVNQIRPRDFAQRLFFALDRPLPLNNEMQQSVENAHQDWEEDFEEESSVSSNTTPPTNPFSPYLTSSPFHPAQSTIPMTSTEVKIIVDKFLDIGSKKSKVEEEETTTSTDEVKKKAAITNSQGKLIINSEELKRKKQELRKRELERKKREITLYLTNIVQKRRLKMNKHKHKKLRKRQRALRKRLGK